MPVRKDHLFRIQQKEGRDTYFEILGKFDTSVLVYKMVSRKHYITRYDQHEDRTASAAGLYQR